MERNKIKEEIIYYIKSSFGGEWDFGIENLEIDVRDDEMSNDDTDHRLYFIALMRLTSIKIGGDFPVIEIFIAVPKNVETALEIFNRATITASWDNGWDPISQVESLMWIMFFQEISRLSKDDGLSVDSFTIYESNSSQENYLISESKAIQPPVEVEETLTDSNRFYMRKSECNKHEGATVSYTGLQCPFCNLELDRKKLERKIEYLEDSLEED